MIRWRARSLGGLLSGVTLALVLALVSAAAGPAMAQAQEVPASGEVIVGEAASEGGSTWGAKLQRALWIFLMLCVLGFVLLVAISVYLLWRAKKLVENAVKPDLPGLEKLVEQTRSKHPELDRDALAKRLIQRQANRAGLVGFVTGVGGLPTLPIAVPIDIAATIKLQSNLVHMLRINHGDHGGAEEMSEASLWMITTGGQEIVAASGAMVRKLVVGFLSKSLLKFLPLIGGVVGFALNWVSTQTLGRLTLKWLENRAASPMPSLAAASAETGERPSTTGP
ncbi:MAG: hypothetical protein AAF560_13860 [Acidobacteriota bacterium]